MRTLKGTLIRTLPDWSAQKMMISSVTLNTIAANTFASIGLFNNSSSGSWLVVWDVQAVCTPGGGQTPAAVRPAYISGPLPGGFTTTFALVPTAGVQAGLLASQNPYTNPHVEFASYPLVNATWQWGHEWPFAYVPAGYSLTLNTDSNGATVYAVTFAWEVVGRL